MFMRSLTLAGALLALAHPLSANTFEETFPQYMDVLTPEDLALMEPLDFQQGEVSLGNGLATMTIPEGYLYLDPRGAAHVLEQIWGNPPDDGVLGLVMPADITPLHAGGWGLTVHYEEIGYVSDEDAAGQDYDALLRQMQRDTRDENTWRRENGYDNITLVGWAEPPFYDSENRVLYWAKELNFSSMDGNTLNFNIRILGRKGVLVQNFIANIDELPRVKADLPAVLEMTSFTDGNRYVDFDPSLDTVAAVGIGGLIAGKAAAKTGLLAIALLFLKKAWFVLLLPLFWLKNLFTRRNS